PLRHHRAPRPPRQGAQHQPAGGHPRHRPAPPRQPAQALRRPGRTEGGRRRGNRPRGGGECSPRRADLCHPSWPGNSPAARRGAGAEQPMRLTVPTLLTLLRMLLIPVLVLVFYLPFKWTNVAAAAIFAFASLTDWADGWIARRYNQYSNFGAFLDPVADKLMVAVALMLIVQAHPTVWMALWAAVIIGREIAVSALREWMAEVGQRSKVKVATLGKLKTVVQMVALVMLLYQEDLLGLPVFVIGEWLLAGAALLTLWSGFEYLRAAWPSLKEDVK